MTEVVPRRVNQLKPRAAFWIILACLASPISHATEWVRPGINSDSGVWGIEGGLKFAVHPSGFTGGTGGPRGLIRLGYPVYQDGGYDLINFIAVEPVVDGNKGFSELESSQLDNVQGKRFWTDDPEEPGNLWSPEPGVEQLDVLIRVERFLNGAHIYLVVSQRSDAPDEIRLTIHTEPDGAPMNFCILSATMGNKVRARQLWFRDSTISSLDLYPDYQGTGFAPHSLYGMVHRRTPQGDLVAAITRDEEEGSRVEPWPAAPHWNYQGVNVTQYWKKLRGTFRDDLRVAVNARYTYWMSDVPIPGGISYENFEMREGYFEGQQFIFGLTTKTPEQLGLGKVSILEQPKDIIAWAGEDITFSAVISEQPTTLEWEVSVDHGDTWVTIGGATDESYSIVEVPLVADRNQYRLVVTDQYGLTLVSDAAILRVGDRGLAPVAQNVVAHYRFEEGRLGRWATGAVDSSGNGHHLGEVIGAPGYSQSVPASALHQSAENNARSLDVAGGGNAIQGRDGHSLSQVEWEDFTIEAWVRVAVADGGQESGGFAGDSFFGLEKTAANRFRVVAFDRTGDLFIIDTSHTFVAGEWTHLAVIGDIEASLLTAYVNGHPVGSAANFRGLPVPQPNTTWTIGRGRPMGWASGQIDEVRFSDAALSPVEFLNFSHAILHFAFHPDEVTTPAGAAAAFSALAGGGGQDTLIYQWQVSADDGASWTNIAGAKSAFYTNEFVTSADDGNQYRVVASRGDDSVISEAALLRVTPAIEAWRKIHFGTVDETGNAALTSDPDGDLFNNLLEYALGTDPNVAGDAHGAVNCREAEGLLTLRFNHIDDPSLVYEVEAANDLMNWMVVRTYSPFTTIGVRRYTEALDDAQRRFLRLSITLLE